MAVNGIEIKVGQVWRCRDGRERKVEGNDGHASYPWDLDDGRSVGNDGFEFGLDDPFYADLIELVKDENGFTIWRGEKRPVPADTIVEVRLASETSECEPAGNFDWNVEGNAGDIVAYKVHEAAAATSADEGANELRFEFAPEMPVTMEPNALDVQVGGTHYKDCAIQPIEYIHANKLGFAEGNVVKYITRWKAKNGLKDLEKARHYIDLLIELEIRQEGTQK